MNQQPRNPLPIFCSYAQEDEKLRKKLHKHLTLLQNNHLITTWDDRHITPGTDRSHTIDQYLKKSAVILLLISPDYLASVSCYKTEMPQALERHRMGKALVIPVLLRPVDLDATPFAHLQCLPRNGKPVTQWDNQDTALREIAKELRHLLEDMSVKTSEVLSLLKPVEHRRSFHMQDADQMIHDKETEYRIKYLKHLAERYSTVMLPIGPIEGLALQAIFQPLTLRHDPLAVEDVQREQWRTLFARENMLQGRPDVLFEHHETPLKEERPVVVAHTSQEALEKSPQKRMVILGGPGTGKTTVLQFLIHEQAQKALADPNAPLPIMVSLPDLARSGGSLQKYLSRLTEEAWVPDDFALTLARAIEDGEAFICLDSLDEVTPELRPDTIRMINERASHRGNVWIVGSRFTDYKGGQFQRGQFAEWELQPMTHTLRLELARRLLPELSRLSLHHRAQGDCNHLAFVHHLEAHSQAAAWGENPLLFSLAAVVFVRLGHLPSSRVALYEQVIKAVLQIREKNPRRQTMLYHVISYLALELYTRKGRTFNSQDLLVHLPVIRQNLRENWTTEDMAQRLLNSGILNVLPHEVCSFRHQTFQEYLAAVALAQQLVNAQTSDAVWEFIWQRRTYSRWTEVLRLMVGVLIREHHREGAHKACTWLSALIEQQATPKGDPGNQGLSLVLKSLAEIPKTTMLHWKAMGGNEVEDMAVTIWVERVFEAARHGYKKQQHSLEALGTEIVHLRQRVTKVAMQRMQEVLRDGTVETRTAAVEELAQLGVCAPIEPLVAALQDEATSVRAAAAKVLGGLEANIPIEALLVATHDPCEEVRAAAIEALGGLGKSAPLEPLQIALNDPAWNVRRAAVKALGEPGLLAPLEVFIAMTQDEDPSVRIIVLEGLGKMGANAPLELLLAALKDRDHEVRAAAARALAHLGEQMPIAPLLETLKNQYASGRTYDDIAGFLIKQIERVPSEALVPIMEEVRKGISHSHWPAQQRSIFYIVAEMGARAPLDLVLTALSDEMDSVREAAVRAIGKLKVLTAGERVLSILNSGNEEPRVRAAAVEAIVYLKEEDTGVKILLDALNDPVEQVRVAAAKMLRQIKTSFSAEQLLTEACKRYAGVRISMISLLGKLEGQAPLPLLLSLLNDENETEAVRAAAGRALVDLGEHVPIAMLQSIIHHENSKIRQGIAWKLSNSNLLAFVEDVPVISLLVALRHENWHTRLRAAQKLAYDKEDSLGHVLPKQELITFKNWLHSQKEAERIIPAELLEILVEILLKDDDNGMDTGIHKVAARVLGELEEFIPTKLVQRLFAASHDKKSQMRPGVFEALIGLGSLLPGDWLIEALAHEDWQWRKTAAYTMGMRKDPLFVQSLLVALGDPHPKVRRAAAQALEKIHLQPSAEPLLAVLHDTDMCVRLAVASTLSTFVISFSPSPVLEALAHPNVGIYLTDQSLPAPLNDEVRETCDLVAKVLDDLGTYVPREMLISAAQSEDWEICTAAIRSLIKRGESISWELLFKLGAKKGWRQRRYNSFPYDMEEIPEMVQEDALRQGGEIGNWVAYILGRKGRKTPEKLLLRMMDEGDDKIRYGVSAGLGQSGINEPIELLERVLQHGNPRMRVAATMTLSSMLEEDIPPTPLLFLALQDKDVDVLFHILRPIASNETQIPLDPLLTCLYNIKPCTERDDWALSYIVRALGARSLEEQIPLEPILNLFDRENVRLRASVIRILGRFGTRAPVDLLIATLGDSEQSVREAAAETLKQAHPEALHALASEAVSLLQEQKSGSPFDSVAHAFFADLVKHVGYASPAVFERLTELLDWPYWEVRVKAIRAFGELRRSIPDKAIRRLLELRDDPQSRAVRQAADEVLAEILSLETGIEDD